MKRILLTLTVSVFFGSLLAQTGNNPFAKLGYKKHIMYTSSKGEFEEFHDMDDVVEIGSALFNTKTNQIVGFIDEQQEETEVASATAAMSIDPLCEKYYWITPYAFCINNPIRFVDPDGREIKLAGTAAERQTSLTHLQRLTNDKLGMRSNGTVIISRMGGENSGKYLRAGSELIRDLNQKGAGAKTVTISIGTGGNRESHLNANSTNGVGTDSNVTFDPTSNPSILTKDPVTGNVSGATRPNEIGLGHELIHAERAMTGKSATGTTTQTYTDSNGNPVTETVRQEEVETVGTQGNHKYTENKLRREQGLNERGAY